MVAPQGPGSVGTPSETTGIRSSAPGEILSADPGLHPAPVPGRHVRCGVFAKHTSSQGVLGTRASRPHSHFRGLRPRAGETPAFPRAPRKRRRGVKSAHKPLEPIPNPGTTPSPWGIKYLDPRSPSSISIGYEQRTCLPVPGPHPPGSARRCRAATAGPARRALQRSQPVGRAGRWGDLIAPVKEALARYQPSQRCLLLDEGRWREDDPPGRNLVSALPGPARVAPRRPH